MHRYKPVLDNFSPVNAFFQAVTRFYSPEFDKITDVFIKFCKSMRKNFQNA
jgi:hypothetical protein